MPQTFVTVLKSGLILALISFVCPIYADQDRYHPNGEEEKILILTASQYGRPVTNLIVDSMVNRLTVEGISLERIFVENLDLQRNPDPEYRRKKLELIKHKHQHHHPGIIAVVHQGAMDFITSAGDDFFPEALVLAPLYERDSSPAPSQRQKILMTSQRDIEGTLEHALKLFPNTNSILLVAGDSSVEQAFHQRVETHVQSRPMLTFSSTQGLEYESMLAKISSLPEGTLIFYSAYFSDTTGRTFTPAEVASDVAHHANRPTFAFRDIHIKTGIMGGSAPLTQEVGYQAADVILQRLKGAFPIRDQITHVPVQNYPIFNWPALNYWKANHRVLPENTVFLNKPASVFDMPAQTKWVIGVSFAVLAILLTILGLQNRRQHKAMQLQSIAEEKLRQSETSYRQLIDGMRETVWVIATDGRILNVNDTATKVLGFSKNELQEGGLKTIDKHLSEEKIRQIIAKMPSDRIQNFESVHTTSSGQSFPVEIQSSLIEYQGQTAILSIARNISDRKAAQNELLEANQRLKQATERAQQLAEAAEAANRAKGEFLANMSHEIRTPLNGVIGMTDYLQKTHLNEDQRTALEIIYNSGQVLLNVINDVLDFAKIESGNVTLDAQPIDFIPLIENCVSRFALSAHQKGVEIICHIDPEIESEYIGDATRLLQILNNLISNAVKFTEQGEILVKVEKKNLVQDTQWIEISVKDSGIGIPKSQQGGIFDRFRQVDASDRRKYGGTGLGLAITKQLVELLGGTVSLESEEDIGSNFVVSLPLIHNASKTIPALKAPSLPGRIHAIIFSQNGALLDSIRVILQKWNILTSVTDNFAELEKLLENQVMQPGISPVVLFDIPCGAMHLSSLQSLENWLRQNPQTPIILLTPMCINCDLGDYPMKYPVNKPISRRALAKSLEDCAFGNATRESIFSDMSSLDSVKASLHKARILVAEDNRVNQRVIHMLLKRLGFTAEIVNNGHQAVRALQHADFDLVLMDLQMPEMDGLEATKIIRKAQHLVRNPSVPIVALTARALAEDYDICINAGMNDYIAKPVELEKLSTILQKWLPPTG